MADLKVEFCGIKFKNPFLLSSAPPAGTGEMIARAFDAGWAGAVTKTLVPENTEMVNVSPRLNCLSFEGFEGESKNIYAMQNIELASDRKFSVWEREIEELSKNYRENVIIASIMAEGDRKEDWQALAVRCENAGARALELNFSCPHGGMPGEAVGSAIGQDARYTEAITGWVREVAKVPVLAKLTPNVTDVTVVGNAAKRGGAHGLTAINTVLGISGVNLDTFVPYPAVKTRSAAGGLSGLAIKPIALRIVAELAKGVGLPVSGLGGIATWRDAAEFITLGAGTVQLCTAVMLKGYGIIEELTQGLNDYLDEKGFGAVTELRGRALPFLWGLMELDRGYRVISKVDESVCVKCDICYISCRDSGYQAITMTEDRIPVVDREKCKGCGLCMQVCPVWDCITMEES
jgi:dihydropyrimidine dehydrogenase (NAD+) subunit PreA